MANTRANAQHDEKGSPITARRVVAVVLVAAVVTFVVQNTNSTEVSWLGFTFTAQLWLLTLILLGIGFAIGWLVGRPSRRQRKG